MPNTAVFLDIDWTLGHTPTKGTIGYNEKIAFSHAEETRLKELEALAIDAKSMSDGNRIDFCIMTSNCVWNKEKILAVMKDKYPTLYDNVRATNDSQARDIVNTIMSDDAKKHQKESEVSFPAAIELMQNYKKVKNDAEKVILAIKALRDAKHAGIGTRWFSSDKIRYKKFEEAYGGLCETDKTAFKNIVHQQMRGELNKSVRGVFSGVTRTMRNVERITGLTSLPNGVLGDGGAPDSCGKNRRLDM